MRRALLPFALACSLSCSWTAFDAYSVDTPVTAFSNRAYGARVAITTDAEGNAILGAGGADGQGARFYTLRDGRSAPTGVPLTNDAVCEVRSDRVAAGTVCLPAKTLTAAGIVVETIKLEGGGIERVPHPGCFAIGYGRQDDAPGIIPGPIVYCTDGGLFTLGPAGDSTLAAAFKARDEAAIRAQRVALATVQGTGTQNPPLVLGSEVDERAWVYPVMDAQVAPLEITAATGTKGDRYGAAVAIARAGADRVFLVSAPAVGQIFAFHIDPATPSVAVNGACLTGSRGLGETLATGDVDLDGLDDVLTNEDGAVIVFLGKDRPAPPAAGDPCPEWKRSTIVLRCSETRGASACADSGFGASIAVGDFDKNGRGDVAVGAPYVTTEGVASSGAVFLFSPAVGAPNDVLDVRYLSEPKQNAAFGAAVASGSVGGQDTLAVGATGRGIAYVVWCTNLEGNPRSPRCRR